MHPETTPSPAGVTLPLTLFSAMAACYYGTGPRHYSAPENQDRPSYAVNNPGRPATEPTKPPGPTHIKTESTPLESISPGMIRPAVTMVPRGAVAQHPATITPAPASQPPPK